MSRHVIDVFGRKEFGRHDRVAFILAVFLVDRACGFYERKRAARLSNRETERLPDRDLAIAGDGTCGS